MATNSREARRRKIMERGSDRLALITGRIQTLPSSSSSSPSSPPDPAIHREDDTDPLSQPLISHGQDPQTQAPDQIQEEEVSRAADSQVQPLSASSRVQNAPSLSSSPSPSLLFEQRSLFTASRISGAIEASESTRFYISIALALLVVFAHLDLLGSKMAKTLFGFRPLYLVLLTNVTLVVARILGGKRASGALDMFGGVGSPTEGYEWAEHLGKALEIGLVVKKVLDALSMDCAVYAVIVVCGLSFAQQFH